MFRSSRHLQGFMIKPLNDAADLITVVQVEHHQNQPQKKEPPAQGNRLASGASPGASLTGVRFHDLATAAAVKPTTRRKALTASATRLPRHELSHTSEVPPVQSRTQKSNPQYRSRTQPASTWENLERRSRISTGFPNPADLYALLTNHLPTGYQRRCEFGG